MRLLLWVLLATLLTLLSSTNASSSKLSNKPDAANVDSTFPVPATYPGYNGKPSRGLRADEREVPGNDGSVEEERAFSVSNILNRGKQALRTRLSAQAQKLLEYTVKRAFIHAYKKGITPETLFNRAKMMGKNDPYVGEYKIWYDKVRATGKFPKVTVMFPKKL
ncbi:hypothetical protein PF005_g30893 [Phytophthora fragariae]|uniref:RxLR effector protein n=1 Tax=Phytophthora fragariae TaxID=53985 RepID=A0A6A3PUG6_9STRA|nr:hypothetical protein PF003_g15606 [Phytophthora fragariae]KAE8918631.1 hypothetical protein PF009_g31056 [Phytophthora fragariae]KAE8966977.1 hypothetical protein PF011_g27732 [Phytophthora fragariae]KAE9060551.1 hypothetical protein PF007_g30566 [Phytophthora fragariae]KAE9064154.1 hypothetical protein PF010_g28723 [Phytophthora fragariae]